MAETRWGGKFWTLKPAEAKEEGPGGIHKSSGMWPASGASLAPELSAFCPPGCAWAQALLETSHSIFAPPALLPGLPLLPLSHSFHFLPYSLSSPLVLGAFSGQPLGSIDVSPTPFLFHLSMQSIVAKGIWALERDFYV